MRKSLCRFGAAGPPTDNGRKTPVAITCAIFSLLLIGVAVESRGDSSQQDQAAPVRLTQNTLEELGQIEVTTTSKEPVKVSRTPAAIYVITQEDIRRSGATNVPEALRLVPGVEVARVDSNTWSIGVRGFGNALSRDVLVLIDGRSVYTPLYAGVYWDVQNVILEDVDRIEVIRGPGGTIWGANAVNGVINIITKNTKDTRGMLVSSGGGNVDQGFVNLRYGGGNDKNFNYRIYGKAFTDGPELHPNGGSFDSWRMGQTGFRTDLDLHDRDSFTFQGDLYDGGIGQSVEITSYSAPYLTDVQRSAEVAGGNLLGRWKRTLGAGSDIQLQTYYDRTNQNQASFAESRDTFDLDFIHHFPLPRHQDFLWGLGVRVSSGNTTEVVPTVAFTPNKLTDRLYSGFIQDEIPIIGNRFSLTIGSKFLQETYSPFEFEPTARLLWTPNARQTIWGAVTRAVRTPSRVEEDLQLTALLTPNPLTFIRAVGDRGFSTEHMLGYEVGYRSLVRPKLNLDIAAFYNNYDHLLSIEPGAPFTETSPAPTHVVVPFFFGNGLLGDTAGFEIAPEWAPTSRWRLRGSYSYLHLNLSKSAGSLDPTTVASTEGSSPHHEVMAESFLNLPKRLEFDQTLRYVSNLPAQQVPAYTTADVRFSWHATQSFEFSVLGQNLLQPHHDEFGGDPGGLVGIKRTVYAKITWQTTQR